MSKSGRAVRGGIDDSRLSARPSPRRQASRNGEVLALPLPELDLGIDGAVLSALEEGVVVVDRNGGLIRSNAAASVILGVDLDAAAPGSEWWTVLAARRSSDGRPLDVGAQVLRTGQEARAIDVEVQRGGAGAWLSVNYLALRGDRGAIVGLVVSFRDISEQRRERRDLLDTQTRLREAHDVARLASWEWRPETGEVMVFQALAESGFSPGTQVTLERWLAILPPAEHQRVLDDFEAFTRGEKEETVECFRYMLADRPVWLELRSRAVRDDRGRLECVRGTAQDVSEQELTRQQLKDTGDFLQATLDSLPTHVAVLDQHGEIVMTNRAWSGFAAGNGSPSPSGGVGANYLAACDAASGDTSADLAATGLRGIAAGTETDFSMEYPCHGPHGQRWFQLRATRYDGSGPTRVVVTHENISERKAEERLVAVDLDKLAWVARIEEALTADRFVLHAQPILELATGQIVQRELLIRMSHPEDASGGRLVPPASFLPVAEEFGLITQIDRWVIDRSAELAARGMPVELNVSGRSIGDPRLVDYIRSAIERTGADPQALVFEITETTLIEDDTSARAFVTRLHELGCRIALDDFGTGYGGFTYLKQLQIDFLKIDIEFVRDLSYNPASRTVVQAIVKLAQGFGLKTVAEGVEDEASMDALHELGVDYAQGYHIGPPAPLALVSTDRKVPA